MTILKRAGSANIFFALIVRALAVSFVFGALAQEPPPPKPIDNVAALRSRLHEHVSQPRFAAAMWGVKIVSLDTCAILFEHNAEKLFSPASNSKLYTTALALNRLGADHRIKTSLYAAARPNKAGTLQGDLIVYGRGDPTINARLHERDIYKALEPLVAALTNAGVKRIKGDLIGDESFFRGPPFGSGWDWEDLQYYYGAEVSALAINDNTLQLSVKPGERLGAPCRLALSPATKFVTLVNQTQTATNGTKRSTTFFRPLAENAIYVTGQMALDDAAYNEDVAMHKPAGLFVTLFKEALARHRIKVSGRVRTMNWLDRKVAPLDLTECAELGSIESPPLREIVREIQKPSQNLYTDMLLAHVGEGLRSADAAESERTSEDLGIKELNTFLAEVGIRQGDVQLEEGSGLSRNNLTTPNATIKLLEFMSRHKCADVFRDALPIADVDGTLKNRMKNTPAAGNVRAKTGTLRWANSLSGHVTTLAGEHLIFSIMLNRYHNTDSNRPTRTDLDAIAVMLASFTGHSDRNGE